MMALSPADSRCSLRFWTHMKGDHIERLNIKTRTTIGGPEDMVKSLDDQYPEWTLQTVSLSSNVPFQVGYVIYPCSQLTAPS